MKRNGEKEERHIRTEQKHRKYPTKFVFTDIETNLVRKMLGIKKQNRKTIFK